MFDQSNFIIAQRVGNDLDLGIFRITWSLNPVYHLVQCNFIVCVLLVCSHAVKWNPLKRQYICEINKQMCDLVLICNLHACLACNVCNPDTSVWLVLKQNLQHWQNKSFSHICDPCWARSLVLKAVVVL